MKAHDDYAHRQASFEKYTTDYNLTPEKSGVVAAHTSIQKLRPDIPQLIRLMRLDRRKTWADFGIPKDYYYQRSASAYIAASLGNQEKIAADMQRLAAMIEQQGGFVDAAEDERLWEKEGEKDQQQKQEQSEEGSVEDEGQTIIQFLHLIKVTNEMIDEVYARMKQFLQG
ncbi:MAG: DUF5399 family protein [Chlamydiales bacterium]|nr:DUF5399 family protein [Chlamydiales bacterium]